MINNNCNINFKGIYRLPNVGDNLNIIQRNIIPSIQIVKHENAYAFAGKNPLHNALKQGYEKGIAEAKRICGYCEEWIKADAKRHNIDLSVFDEDKIYVLTGKKDIDEFLKYLSDRSKDRDKLSHKIKEFINIWKITFKIAKKDLPEHLQLLKIVTEETAHQNNMFEKFINNRAIDIKNPVELVQHISKY